MTRENTFDRESVAGKTWYCPNGCQAFTPRLPGDSPPECGRCGAVMTTTSREFDAVHDAIERDSIAAMTHRRGTRP